MKEKGMTELIIVVRVPETLAPGSNNTMQVAKLTVEPPPVSADLQVTTHPRRFSARLPSTKIG